LVDDNWEGFVRQWPWTLLRLYFGIFQKKVKTNTRKLNTSGLRHVGAQCKNKLGVQSTGGP